MTWVTRHVDARGPRHASCPVRAKAASDLKPFRILPAGAHVTLDREQMTVTGDRATVPVTVTGSTAAGKWTLLLARSNRQWLLYATLKS